MADFYELEANDGIRMPWNVWVNSKQEALKAVVPFSALYTPTKQLPNLMTVPYEGVPCKHCGAFLNPYVRVDFAAKLWVCPFCHSRNHFPPHYQGISEASYPAELFPQYTTIEYTLPKSQAILPPSYVFVVDTCVAEDELVACKAAIAQALQFMPESSYVGLVTYGTHVQVHELGFAGCPKSYVLRGNKEYTIPMIREQLGLVSRSRGGMQSTTIGQASSQQQQQQQQQQPQQPAHAYDSMTAGLGKFLLPVSECEFSLNSLLDDLTVDPYPAVGEQRAARCTGPAIQVATALVSSSIPAGTSCSRVMLFVGGPSTIGPGKMVNAELSEPIRSHKDLSKDEAPHFKPAVKFYTQLSRDLVSAGASLDAFVCALEQVGLAEMKIAVERSGGITVLADTFTNEVFRDSFRRMFRNEGEEGHLGTSSHALLEVIPSRDIKVAGILGPAAPTEPRAMHADRIAEAAVGVGGTNVWKLTGLDTHTTVAVLFDVAANYKDQQEMMAAAAANQQLYLQFITRYLHPRGEHRMRVTTLTRRWSDGSNSSDLIAGFDQEAAAVVMGRLCSYKMEEEEEFDATRWLDRALIKLCNRFGDYRKDDPSSFQLSPQLSIYPQFMFNFRRSQFVQVFGNSPDETAYCRMILNRETVSDAMVMIQPQLTSYSFNGPPEPVLLDVSSIQPDRILVLDAYFSVVVFHGTTIAQWRRAGYHELPEHAAFAQLLAAAKADAEVIMRERFPTPRFVDCDQHGSQSRFLLAKLNPSATYNTAAAMSAEVIMTDDVSLQVFLEHLRKLAVQQT